MSADWLTIPDVARRCACSPKAARRLMRLLGKPLPGESHLSQYRVLPAALDVWLIKQEGGLPIIAVLDNELTRAEDERFILALQRARERGILGDGANFSLHGQRSQQAHPLPAGSTPVTHAPLFPAA